jgi:ketosteroid isomerase-like protein
MYRALIARIVRAVFERLSEGDYRWGLRAIAPDVHHRFAGEHPLGGERHSREAMERWFERLFRLFPKLKFRVREVVAKGWPWNTVVAVEWAADVTPAQGQSYENKGAHFMRIRWGRVTHVHAYEDSQLVAEACRRMAVSGIEEAAARPISS